jgi:hypothetical protein
MAVPAHLRGIKGDECQCGRRASVRHCPVCGSSRLYAFSNEQWREKLDGSGAERVRLSRCISCAHRFTDAEREFCDAPPISTALATLKLKALQDAKAQGEYLRPNDEKIASAIEQLLVPTSKVDMAKAHKDLVFRLTIEYADKRADLAKELGMPANKLKEAGLDLTESVEEYIQRRLIELGAPQREVVTPIVEPSVVAESPLSQEVETVEELSAEAEQALRSDWARQKLMGRAPTKTVEEFIERKRRGEVI